MDLQRTDLQQVYSVLCLTYSIKNALFLQRSLASPLYRDGTSGAGAAQEARRSALLERRAVMEQCKQGRGG